MQEIEVMGMMWGYRMCRDRNGVVVKLYDESGMYVTEFQSEDEMKEYIGDGASRGRMSGLNDIRRFRQMDREKYPCKEKAFELGPEEKESVQRDFMMRFRMLRGEMDRKEFADALGIEYGIEYGYETGRRFPVGSRLRQIAERSGVTVDWLIGRDD